MAVGNQGLSKAMTGYFQVIINGGQTRIEHNIFAHCKPAVWLFSCPCATSEMSKLHIRKILSVLRFCCARSLGHSIGPGGALSERHTHMRLRGVNDVPFPKMVGRQAVDHVGTQRDKKDPCQQKPIVLSSPLQAMAQEGFSPMCNP
jgi:hypothetical protein